MDEVLAFAARIAPRPKLDVYSALCAMDERLQAKGFPPISPWWRGVFRDFYGSPRRRLVIRAGRRGGKSSSLCRVAVAEVLYGDHAVPPGDTGVFAFVSTKKGEAVERLNTIAEILEALGVSYDRHGDEIRPHGLNRCWRIYAANYRTAVGMTLIGLVADEVARWRDEDTGANPATEVLRSMRPAMATQHNAREFLSSSPFSTLDAHYEAFELGNTDEQMVAAAPSWVANPTLTEARCRELEPDEPTFRREYGAEPMGAGLSTFFDPRAVDEAAGDWDTRVAVGDVLTAGADFGFRRDSSGLCVMRLRGDVRTVIDTEELRPIDAPLKPSEVVARFAAIMARHGVEAVMGDGHYRESIVEHLAARNLGFLDAPTDVPETYVRLRVLLHQGLVQLPKSERLIRDLKEIRSRPTASGRLTMLLPKREGGGHADLVSALVLACWQKAGTAVQEAQRLPEGWTQHELDEVTRLEERIRRDRGDSLYSGGGLYG